MNYARLSLSFLGASVAYLVCGFILLAALPAMKSEFLKYPAVYRSQESMMKVMPYNLVAILVSIAVVVIIYARMYPAGAGSVYGITFGVLIGIFAVCTYAVHNYAMLNISPKLSLYEAATYFIQWVVVGAAIGLIYKAA